MRVGFSILVAVLCARVAGAASFALDYDASVNAEPRRLVKSAAASVQRDDLQDGTLRSTEILTACAPRIDGEIAVGDTIDVMFFDNRAVTLTVMERAPSMDGNAAFLATADGYEGRLAATVVCSEGRINIDLQDFLTGKVYSVLSSSEWTVVREIDARRLPCECGKPRKAPSRSAAAGIKSASRLKAAASAGLSLEKQAAATVDILVVYDTYAAAWAKAHGGGVRAFAEVQVQKMNIVLANTCLDQHFRFRLVDVYEVGGSAGGDIFDALEAAQSGSMELNGVVWDGVHAKRDEVAADIVCVLVDNGSAYGTTGVSYSLEADSGCFSEYAYNSCLVRAVANGQTMTHEVGHNMGAGHATAMADVDSRGPQYFSYSAGHYFTGVDGCAYHTIMAYSSDGYGNYYTPVPFFSSPNYTYKSVSVGDQDHDNSLTLRQTFTMISQYREAGACTVALGKNGGTGGDSCVAATFGQPMPTPRAAPKMADWTFEGYWDTVVVDANGDPIGKQYYDADMNSVRTWDKKHNATLWAKWTKKVTLGKNSGTGGDNYVVATFGQSMPTPRTAPTLKGWTFGGYWDTVAADVKGNPVGKQYYGADMSSVRTCGKTTPGTLWAKWTVRVALGKNGGTGGDDYVTATRGRTFPRRTMPKIAGCTFGGYWISSRGRIGQCYNSDGTGTESMMWLTGGTPTIWALWSN